MTENEARVRLGCLTNDLAVILASYYEKLIDCGVPENLAHELTGQLSTELIEGFGLK